jgi:outer membrane receptor for ferrienterochelin and colicins
MNRVFLLSLMMLILSISLHAQQTIKINVSGECGMCEERIEKTASSVIGVSFADYDLDSQILDVEFDPKLFRKQELVSALIQAGHDADGIIAPDNVYSSLPACCHYREQKIKNHPESATQKSQSLDGLVFEINEKGVESPLIGATVLWAGTSYGTVTDAAGMFRLPMQGGTGRIVISYVGYTPDTIAIEKAGTVRIVVSPQATVLEAVEISYKRRTTEVSFIDPVKIQQISSKELLKAACCNLAESFDTTPAVDASVTDAITGTRKIEMLGLAGPYVQITRENIPDVRGLAALQGLVYTPGPWVEGMQLNMGAGSVVNGFESITGQINVELKKPCYTDKMYFNAYASQAARLEMNTFAKQDINENWSISTLLHASTRNLRRDHNHDSFLDMPLGNQFGFVNRWKWTNNSGQEGQIGMKLSFMDNVSGQTDFKPGQSDRSAVWGADMQTKRAEIWGKRGFVNLSTPYKTLGFQFSGVYHDQKSQFGMRRYDATQKSLYFNMIYQNIINNTDHQVRMGSSVQYDDFDETISGTFYDRNEIVPGVFGEYTYKGSEKFTLLVGGRADYHNNFGLFFTPRLNVRYAPDAETVIRISGGRGQKTASIFAENIGVLASNRTIIVEGNNSDTPYGLQAEVAWNSGASITREIKMGARNLFLSADFNYINFSNQIVVDLDRTARQVVFYNLRGESWSKSFQFQAEFDPAGWMDVRLAYRYNDVRTTYGESLLRKPLVSPQRAFANVAIRPGKGWSIDYTINWLSSMRIPSTADNDENHRWIDQSPAYFLSNAQISKNWNETFEVYLGGENIFDYRLKDPIISAHDPFGTYFDSSLAWGPIMGVNIYAGIRYSIQ